MLKTLLLLSLVVFAAALLGCQSDGITAKSVRKDMSPEMKSIALMHEQRKNVHARTKNTNKRQIWDDIDSILLLDRPVRLSEYPIP